MYPVGGVATCVPEIDGMTVRGDHWSTPLPVEATDARVLDWSERCDLVLVAAGAGAWTCRAAGCTRLR